MRELDELIDDIDKLVDWQVSESPAARTEFGGHYDSWYDIGELQDELRVTMQLWLPGDREGATATLALMDSGGLMNVPVLPRPLVE